VTILGQLARALTNRDWFTVAVEVLIVVAGIFIGLQVDDWNTTRQDRRDEQIYLQRLHDDMLLAESLSDRLRDRRLASVRDIVSALEVLFGRESRDALTDAECKSIGSSNIFNINVPSLPAFEELIGVGRLGIIKNAELRTALIGFRQTRAALTALVAVQSSQASLAHLPTEFPDLIQMEPYLEADSGEVRANMTCNVSGMRENQRFLNQLALNADGYDAFIRDGLAPWSVQFEAVHNMLDEALGIAHGADN
jgi:hypothetical protein